MLRYFRKIVALLFGTRWARDRHTALLGLDVPLSENTPEVEAEFARRLAAMPVFVRKVFLLRTVDRMSIEQIARRLAISRREVRKNLRRAIALLLI